MKLVILSLFISSLAAADSLVVTQQWEQLNKGISTGTYSCAQTPVECSKDGNPKSCDLSQVVCAKGKKLLFGYNQDGRLAACCH